MRSICHSKVIEITFTTEHLSVLLLFLLCCVAVEDCRSNLWCVFFRFVRVFCYFSSFYRFSVQNSKLVTVLKWMSEEWTSLLYFYHLKFIQAKQQNNKYQSKRKKEREWILWIRLVSVALAKNQSTSLFLSSKIE